VIAINFLLIIGYAAIRYEFLQNASENPHCRSPFEQVELVIA
jgi:hypothetical protein